MKLKERKKGHTITFFELLTVWTTVMFYAYMKFQTCWYRGLRSLRDFKAVLCNNLKIGFVNY